MTDDPLLDWVSVPSFGFSRISTKRDRVGFLWDPDGRVDLYTVDFRGGPAERVTHGELGKSPNAAFVWAPDGRSVVIPLDREGNEQHDLYRIDLENRSVTQLTHDPTSFRVALGMSPDGRWILFVSDKGVGDEERQMNLWRMRADGSGEERLARHRQPLAPWSLRDPFSPDGSTVVYAASDEDDPRDAGVFSLRPGRSGPEQILSIRKGSKEEPVTWSPDGRSVAINSDAGDRSQVGVLDLGTREVRWLGPGTADELAVDFSPDGKSLLVYRSEGVRALPAYYDLATGEETLVPLQLDYTAEAGFLADSNTVMAVAVDSQHPHHVAAWSDESRSVRPILPPQYGPVDASRVARSETVRFPSFDGLEIEALLYRPPASGPVRRGPAIVEVHGGPTWQFYDGFDSWAQYFVSRGISVIKPNVRGSTGYGRKFRDLNLRDLGGGDLKDVAASVEYLRRQSFVDADRIGIYGVSYGGYLTYAALTWYPRLWRAGVAIAGVTDWKLCYDEEMPALQHYDRTIMGDPAENAQLYHDRSPVFWAENVSAPIMMIHGLNDPRCPVSQARVFRDALVKAGRREGTDFEYLEFSDIGHGSGDREQLLRSYRPAFRFLEQHLR